MIILTLELISLICFPFFMYSVTKRLKEIRDLLQRQSTQQKEENKET